MEKFEDKYNWAEIQKLYDKGHTIKETAKLLKISYSALKKACRKKLILVRSSFGRKPSQETKEKISRSRKEYLKNNPDKIPYKLNHSSKESFPEKVLRLALEQNSDKINETWVQEYQNSLYSYDFAFPGLKIDIEVDGETHLQEKVKKIDEGRDKFSVEDGWIVLRFSSEQVRTNVNFVIEKIIEVIHFRKNDILFEPVQFLYDQASWENERKNRNKERLKRNNCLTCGVRCYGKVCEKHYIRPQKFTLNKEELQELVNNLPLTKIGILHSISSNRIKKWCVKYNIVLPLVKTFWLTKEGLEIQNKYLTLLGRQDIIRT
jgi:very-short-patch-repair endonuclease